jgi:3-oxoacyl-[acyl-carrier protein] reductase
MTAGTTRPPWRRRSGSWAGVCADGTAVPGSLSASTETASLFDQAHARSGRLDIVVHTPGRVTKTPLAAISDEEFEASIDANLRLAVPCAPRDSPAGGRPWADYHNLHLDHRVTIPVYSIYTGHKAATEHYVRGLAKELGPRDITVNAVAPGPINSPFYFGAETEQSFQAATRLSGAGRLGEWDEIVPLIAFLGTPDAQWITAQAVRINGGMTA